MAKATGNESQYLFQYGLPAVRGIINERTLPVIVKDFVEMAKATGNESQYLFQYGLPAIKHIINERTWHIIVRCITKISKYADYVESQLGFMPMSLFAVPRALLNSKFGFMPMSLFAVPRALLKSKSVYDTDKLLEHQVSLAKQYFNEVGYNFYTKKIINENFWNFQNDNRVFNRLKFEKTGSRLVPLGGRFKTKYLVRIIRQESFEAWKKAQKDNIPVEEIVR